jgi:hypothetical protein
MEKDIKHLTALYKKNKLSGAELEMKLRYILLNRKKRETNVFFTVGDRVIVDGKYYGIIVDLSYRGRYKVNFVELDSENKPIWDNLTKTIKIVQNFQMDVYSQND